MKLRDHATAEIAVSTLNEALSRLASAPNAARDETMRDSFLRAHDDLETKLASTFEHVSVNALLHTARYWHLMSTYLDPEEHRLHVVRPVNMAVHQECAVLKTALTALRDVFASLAAWLKLPGLLVLIDTNVMIHCLPANQIDWFDVLKAHLHHGAPRILVPLPVIDEIDRKKFEAGGTTAKRARAAISWLRATRKDAPAGQAARVDAANGSFVLLVR